MNTKQIITEALDADSVSYSQEGDREFVSVSVNTDSDQSALDFLNGARAYLRSCGWQVTAFSNGFRWNDGVRYATAGVDAMRGEGPRTAYENHMIATCTGND
jgi:hypothetical protein